MTDYARGYATLITQHEQRNDDESTADGDE